MSEAPKTKLNPTAYEFKPGLGFVAPTSAASLPVQASVGSTPLPPPATAPATAAATAASLNINAREWTPNTTAAPFVPKGVTAAAPAVVSAPAAMPARPPSISTEDAATEEAGKDAEPATSGAPADGDKAKETDKAAAAAAPGINWRRGTGKTPVAAVKEKEATPKGWTRGVSAPGALAGHPNDGVLRYDKQALLAFFVKGERQKTCPDKMVGMYPAHMVKERPPVGLPRENHTPKHHGGKTPKHHKSHDGKVNYNVDSAPHPDELVIFSAEHLADESTFRYKPNRVVDDSSPEEVCKKANLILNQLSVEKFEKLSDKFMACGIGEDEDLIQRAVTMIVMKAQLEEHFCFMYADLCRKMIDVWSQRDEEQEKEGAPNLGKIFRNRLLSTCEEEFTLDRVAGLAEIEAMEMPPDEKEEKILIYRKRYLGHMRFIGEVFIKDLVKYTIMLRCIETLIESSEEDSLACMCKLMTTIGAKLEDLARGRSKVRDFMDRLFAQLADKAADSNSFSSRIRFMFKDLIDLRSNLWISRQDQLKATKLTRPASTSSLSSQAGPGSGELGGAPSPVRAASLAGSRQAQSSQDVRALGKIPEDEWSTVSTKKSAGGPNRGQPVVKAGPGGRGSLTPTGTSSGPFSAKAGGSRFGVLKEGAGAVSPSKGKSADKKQGGSSSNSSNSDKTTPKGSSHSAANGDAKSTGPAAPSADAAMPAKKHTKVHSMFNEYYQNEALDEVLLCLSELELAPDGLWDMLREGLQAAMDHKLDDHRKLGALLVELKAADKFSTDHLVFGLTRFLEGFQDLVIDFPHAGVYLGTILAAAWGKDRDILPPLAFIYGCGAAPLPDGEEFEDFEIKDRKRCMATLSLQCVEAMYKQVLSDDGSEAEAEAAARAMVASFGLTAAHLEDALGGGKWVSAALERNAPSTGKLL